MREAAHNGAKIVVLPELCVTGYFSQDGKTNWQLPGWPIDDEYQRRSPLSVAQRMPGTTTRHFCQLTKELGIYLTIPFIAANWSVELAQKWRRFGFSEIISRVGKVLAAAKSIFGSEIVYAELPVAKH